MTDEELEKHKLLTDAKAAMKKKYNRSWM